MPYVETRKFANGTTLRLTHRGHGSWDIEGAGPRRPTRSGMTLERARHLADLSAGAAPEGPWLLAADEVRPGDQAPCLVDDACKGTMTFAVGPDPFARESGDTLFARCDVDQAHVHVAGVYR